MFEVNNINIYLCISRKFSSNSEANYEKKSEKMVAMTILVSREFVVKHLQLSARNKSSQFNIIINDYLFSPRPRPGCDEPSWNHLFMRERERERGREKIYFFIIIFPGSRNETANQSIFASSLDK